VSRAFGGVRPRLTGVRKRSTTAYKVPPDLGKAVAEGKNPYAVMLGRLGGQKGGNARAKALSATRRTEIARNAARARWGRTEG